jgi:hypothetical protein
MHANMYMYICVFIYISIYVCTICICDGGMTCTNILKLWSSHEYRRLSHMYLYVCVLYVRIYFTLLHHLLMQDYRLLTHHRKNTYYCQAARGASLEEVYAG